MSSLIIEVCRVEKVTDHPNADRMAVAHIKGWQVCVAKSGPGDTPWCQPNELVIYIPPDSILPQELADRLGVSKYLAQVPGGGRVKVARLRGFPSYGMLAPLDVLPNPEAVTAGDDVAAILGIKKWEPPLECTDGDAERDHPGFHKYFTLEHWANFPDVFQDGEEIVITEKIHGKNWRGGMLREAMDDGSMIWRFAAGSHDVRRKEMAVQRKRRAILDKNGMPVMVEYTDEPGGEIKEKEVVFFFEVTKKSQFWEGLDIPGIRTLILDACNGQNNVVVFGELFGSGVQDMNYGLDNGNWEIRVFDIAVNGQYLDWDQVVARCLAAKVPTVPVLYRGPYCPEVVQQFVSGPTTMCEPEKAGKFKGREGIVIKAVKERSVAVEKKVFDRAALKAVSFDYLDRKNGSEFH